MGSMCLLLIVSALQELELPANAYICLRNILGFDSTRLPYSPQGLDGKHVSLAVSPAQEVTATELEGGSSGDSGMP